MNWNTSILLAALAVSACASTGQVIPQIAQDDPLPTGSADQVRLDLTVLHRVSAELAASDDHEIHSILVVRGGLLAFESYYNGHSRENPHDIRSATKSITSLLVGIAADQGFLDVEEPVSSHLGSGDGSQSLSNDLLLRHLLTMSSGLDCDDGDRSTRGQEDRMYRSEDWVEYFASLERRYPPGETPRYCTGGVVALGEVVQRAVGKDFEDFAEEVLFQPLGIRNYRWARFDQDRKVDTGGHLLLTPQSMAKIGMLVLQRGKWNGRPIVSETWIHRSTQPGISLRGIPYGYLWWIDTISFGDKQVELIRASGNGGQTIFIVPEFDLVAVFTAGYYNSDRTRAIYELFYNAVMPSIPEIARLVGRGS